jgi:hypothetical protein
MESLDEDDYKAKSKLFYSAMISAWLNTRLERDKQLLGLSATSIGLLVTLLRTVGVSSRLQIVFFALALFAFLTTLISVVYILGENSTHIENLLAGSETKRKSLTVLDTVAGISFIMGIMLVITIGIHSAVVNLNDKGIAMSQEQIRNIRIERVQNDSLNGADKLRPQPPKAPQPSPNNPSSGGSDTSASSEGNGSSNGEK